MNRFGLLVAGLALTACGVAPVREAPQLRVVQEGQLVAGRAADGLLDYEMMGLPFAIEVPNFAPDGQPQSAGHAPILVCASTDAAILQGIAPGMSVGKMPCLNGAAAMARPRGESSSGVDLMLSAGNAHNNLDDTVVRFAPGRNTVAVRQLIQFKATGKRNCYQVLGKERCRDETFPVPFEGGVAYVVVFTDLDRNARADPGEFYKLRLHFGKVGETSRLTTQELLARLLPWQARNQEFMQTVAARPGVTCNPSGLCYEDLVEGKGRQPGPAARVTIRYQETLMNGAYVDSSDERGAPITFPIDRVIPGFSEAVRILRPGGRARFYLPAALGYDDRGAGNRIPPWSVLVMDIELLEIAAR